jgi:hypothetical protein
MGNHYHLVVGGEPDALSSGMRDLNGCHARRMNLRYGRRDHQWGDRYSSTAITSEAQLLYEIRYVVTNPERTENPIRAERYFWSSYNACAGVVIAPPFLAVDHVHGALGAPCVGTDGAAAFREWIAESRKQLVLARPR